MMEIYKLQQFRVLLMCIASGFICAVIFDIFNILRKELNFNNFVSSFADILFWCICTVIVYATIYYSNNADIRWFEFLGLGTGFFAYILFVQKFSFAVIQKIIIVILKIFSIICIPFKLLHILILPVKNLLYYTNSRIFYVFHKIISEICNKAKTLSEKKKKNET